MFDLSEYPGITDSGPADHDTVYPVTVFVFHCFLRTVYIAVSEDGYMNAWVVFYFSDKCPVGIALIHLATGAPMYSECFNTYILQAFGYFFNIKHAVVPAQAGFYCYRQ